MAIDSLKSAVEYAEDWKRNASPKAAWRSILWAAQDQLWIAKSYRSSGHQESARGHQDASDYLFRVAKILWTEGGSEWECGRYAQAEWLAWVEAQGVKV